MLAAGNDVGRLFGLLVVVGWTMAGSVSAEPPRAEPPGQPFVESIYCGICHTNSRRASAMRDGEGRGIAPFDLWRSSAMANASRDPYWKAVVSVEVAATPTRKADIEATCGRCHAPMAGSVPTSQEGHVLQFLSEQGPQALLGRDGVSCTVCHQITDTGLGTEASYTGQFQLSSQRVAFGPHGAPFALAMRQHAGYQTTEGQHILKSALCGTCHTLVTETLDPDGTATGHELHEQSAYLEWRNSVFRDEGDRPGRQAKSCQACHVPVTDVDGQPIRTSIARDPGGGNFPQTQPRAPFGRHTFVGGNTLLAQLLRDNLDELNVFASQAAFDATVAATRTLLHSETATISIGQVQRQGEKLHIPVHIENKAGHKLPTGFPSRRVWVRLEVRAADGQVLFGSGQFDAVGRITDVGGHVLESEEAGGPVQPHYTHISKSAEVQIYESVMADKVGQATFTLLRGAQYLKDNRLLPRGWDPAHGDAAATAPVGVAMDRDFLGGEDVVAYEVPIDGTEPLSIHASLHYQSIGVRHVREVFTCDTPEVNTFKRLYEAADRTPETLCHAVKKLDTSERISDK